MTHYSDPPLPQTQSSPAFSRSTLCFVCCSLQHVKQAMNRDSGSLISNTQSPVMQAMNRDSNPLISKTPPPIILKSARGGLKDPRDVHSRKCGIKAFSPGIETCSARWIGGNPSPAFSRNTLCFVFCNLQHVKQAMNRESNPLISKTPPPVILKSARGGLKDPQDVRLKKCGIKAFSPGIPEFELQPVEIWLSR